jgi:flagellar basal body-associated protein FliL
MKMADTEEPKQENQQEENKTKKDEKKSFISRLLPIVIVVFVVGLCAGAGLGLGRLLAGPSPAQAPESGTNQDEPAQAQTAKTVSNSADSSEGVWYYDLEPVVANLNEPNVARYVSISITLQISSDLGEKNGRSRIEQKLPVLTDWLTVYLAGLSLEDIRGDKNLKSIQSQILDAFNTKLFPDSKPMIKHILFRNFAVQ